MNERESGVSPLIAEILMVALVLLAAGVAYLAIFQLPQLEKIPLVAADITKDGSLVTIFFKNGDPLEQNQFYVTVNGNRVPDGDVSLKDGVYPWTPGERLVVTCPGGTSVRDVKLVYVNDPVSAVLASAFFAASNSPFISVCDDITNPRAFAAGFWSLGEGSGTTARDGSCIATDNGTVINGSYKTCANASVLAFNGASSLVTIPNSAAITSANQITYEAWAYPTEQKTANVVQMRDYDGNTITQDKWRGWTGGVTLDNKTKFQISWAPPVGNRQPPLNTWYHIVLTYDGSYLRLYVNGVEEKSMALSGTLKVSTTAPLVIGSTGTDKFFNGNLANVAVYKRALTPSEIAGQYSANSPGVCPP
ncbi:MAG: type IV pilin [Methanoregula sp.]|nr:type IV pilin [Methanoregula sp.]